MFIGHYAVGFAAKRAAPKTSLGLLIGSAVLLDLMWPVFLLFGWEEVRVTRGATPFLNLDFVSYPISHSLVTSVGWALVAGGVYWIATRYRAGALWIALGVVSHWLLDLVAHRPDLPLWPAGPKAGLGLWNSTFATIAVEEAMLAAGLWIYVLHTSPRDRSGRWAFVAFVVFTLAIYVSSIVSPPPPSPRAVAWVGLAAWILPFWAGWFDRHRRLETDLPAKA
ncbi:MAG TPA: metal-dependent hydrolase [Thermoanaerobaculia bacterium]|nr:metal-dependent hydrolase [Thermoanaerobaculia bacterium]